MSDSAKAWTIIWMFLLPILAVAGLAISAGAISASGRHAWNHQGPLPARVLETSARDYVLLSHAPPVSDVCGGPTDSIRQLQGAVIGLAVRCHRKVTWNDRREHSPSFGEGLRRSVNGSIFRYGVGGLAVLVALPGLFSAALGEGRAQRRAAREARVADALAAKEKKEMKDAKLAALGAAYAREEINDLEFDEALDRSLGLKRPKDTT